MSLPKFNPIGDIVGSKDFGLLQTQWAAQLDPILKRQQNRSVILKEVSLLTGNNTVPTGLGYKLNGWIVVRKRADAAIYDAQDGNPNPNTSLILITDADVVVDLEVF